MAEDHIRYDILAQDALRGVVRKVLAEVAKTGLPGDHHFFISFVTRAPGVRISQRLLDQYDKEMTIVMQNQFWDLKVSETGFEVGLSFDGQAETLFIPFNAIKGFFDPSVQFGLQFDVGNAVPDDEDDDLLTEEHDEDDEPARLPARRPGSALAKARKTDDTADNGDQGDQGDDDDGNGGHKVVSLDSFRKKP